MFNRMVKGDRKLGGLAAFLPVKSTNARDLAALSLNILHFKLDMGTMRFHC